MSEVKWTKEQLNAITKKDSNILVAAAARKWKNSCISWANYKKNNRRQSWYRQNSSSYIHKCSSSRNARKNTRSNI